MPPRKGKGGGKRAAAASGGSSSNGGNSKKAKAQPGPQQQGGANPDKKQQASMTSFLGGSGEKNGPGQGQGQGPQQKPPQQAPITAFFGGGGSKKPAEAARAAAAAPTAVVIDSSSGTEDEGHDTRARKGNGEGAVPQIDLTLLDSPVKGPNKKRAEDVGAVAELVDSADEEGEEAGEGGAVVAVERAIEELPSAEAAEMEAEEGGVGKKEAASAASTAAATPPTRVPHPYFGGKAAAAEATSAMVGSPVDRPCAQYRPKEDACWEQGKPAPYLHMAWAFELLCSTTKRLTKADVLVNMFRSLLALSPEDALPAVYLSSNKLASSFEGVDINVGSASVSSAIVQATGSTAEKLKQLYTEHGDLGDVAQALRVKQRLLVAPKPLTIRDVYRTILDMSKMKGQGCEGRKRHMMVGLIRACRGPEAKFLVRTLVQHIRTGATLTSVLASLAMAAVMHHKEKSGEKVSKAQMEAQLKQAQAAVKECYNACPDIPRIVRALVEGGVPAMQQACAMRVGTPIKPMLAKICSGIPDVLEKYKGEAFTCEYKYDGQRAQIHLLPDGTVKVFNRHIEDMTDKYPDVAALMKRIQRRLSSQQAEEKEGEKGEKGEKGGDKKEGGALQDMILDTELVAVDRSHHNKLLAFQTLATRGRKDVTAEGVAVHVCVFAFDLLYLNGESWVKKPLRERREGLYRVLGPVVEPGHFDFATHCETGEAAEVEAFFDAALEASCEGIMCKSLGHEYEPSKRTDSWLKVKKDYIEGLHDTLDLVPIAAWWGNGRKAGWFSPILVACYDPQREELQSLCRVMSGFTDEFYRQTTAFYQDGRILDGPKPYYRTGEAPPIWLEPCQVWEVRGAELTLSPVHKAAQGKVDSQRGLSLRFPRFLRVREDKGIEDATPAETIADLFRMQVRRVDVPEERMGKMHAKALSGGGKKGAAATAVEEGEGEEEEEEEEEGGLEEDFEL